MGSVHDLHAGRKMGHNDGHQPPEPPDMELTERVKHLEIDVATARTDLAIIKSNYATKADLAETKASIIMWIVGAVFIAQLVPALLKKFGL